MTQTLERPLEGRLARGHERQARYAQRRSIPDRATPFFVAWYDDPLVFRSDAASIDEAAHEFTRTEDQLERDGVPMTIGALEGLYGDRPLVVWQVPQDGTALVNAMWLREGELEPVDTPTRTRVTAWMQERLKRARSEAHDRSLWMVGGTLAVAAVLGLVALALPPV